MDSQIKNVQKGQRVRVYKRKEDEDSWFELHRGIVVDFTNSFIKVYNPDKKEIMNYDATPETANWFAKESRMIKVL